MAEDSKSDLIISASARVFPRMGYHGATVEDILQEANVARSTFYAYFPNKRELFLDVVAGIMSDILGTVEAGIDKLISDLEAALPEVPEDDLIEDELAKLMSDVFGFIDRNRGMANIFLHELVGADEEMSGLFREFQAKVTGHFARLIRFGTKIGVIRDLDQRQTADFIVGGLIHLARNISAGIKKYDTLRLARDFVDLQLRGVLVPQ
jgi:AcrR family transcriptional regulator